jgi:hypothetical protein
MTQELLELRLSIQKGNYTEALALVDELEEMSKQAILRNIESFLIRLFIHLIKNQVEGRLTNSWVASISDSIVRIQKLTLKGNRKSYYINADEWFSFLEEALEAAIAPASTEVMEGRLTPMQLSEQINREQLLETAQTFLDLTYRYSPKELPKTMTNYLIELPGGKQWSQGKF